MSGVGLRLRRNEAKTHAIIAATILWLIAAIEIFGGSRDRYLTGELRGGDFIQIYTLVRMAFDEPFPSIIEPERFQRRQRVLVPAATERYLPVYPPTAALLFAPFRLVSYTTAVIIWTVILIVGCASIVVVTWSRLREHFRDRALVIAAAGAFPPFWFLVLSSQTTLVPLAAFCCAWIALENQRPFLCGAALALLSIKPHLAILVLPALVSARHWAVVVGAVSTVALLLCGVILTMGLQAMTAYLTTIRNIASVEELIEPDPWRMHSVRVFTMYLPHPFDDIAWAVLTVVAGVLVVRVWRTDAPLAARFGVVALGSVLVSPHLFVYDAAVLALSLLWLGGWVEQYKPPFRLQYWELVYLLFIFLLFPTARIVWVQASVLVMSWIFWRLSTTVTRTHRIPRTA